MYQRFKIFHLKKKKKTLGTRVESRVTGTKGHM